MEVVPLPQTTTTQSHRIGVSLRLYLRYWVLHGGNTPSVTISLHQLDLEAGRLYFFVNGKLQVCFAWGSISWPLSDVTRRHEGRRLCIWIHRFAWLHWLHVAKWRCRCICCDVVGEIYRRIERIENVSSRAELIMRASTHDRSDRLHLHASYFISMTFDISPTELSPT